MPATEIKRKIEEAFRRSAEIAKRVAGVLGVANDIEVRLPNRPAADAGSLRSRRARFRDLAAGRGDLLAIEILLR